MDIFVSIVIESMLIWLLIGAISWLALYVLTSENLRPYMRKFENDETLDYIFEVIDESYNSLTSLLFMMAILPAILTMAGYDYFSEKMIKKLANG